jgi:23S rRNA (adenine(2503)-C(2))-methyltransferase
MNNEQLKKILVKNNQPAYRITQIQKAIFQTGILSFLDISNISKELRELLARELDIFSFSVKKILIAKDRLSIKALLELHDGLAVETVLLSAGIGKWSVCISSQAGCALNCQFCATGKNGFKRNLSAEEISDQVLFWLQYLKKEMLENKISNIVYMGMGEPFLNWEEVKKSLNDLIDKTLFAFGSRSISVSTAGIPKGIKSLSEEFPQINLAISLHFAMDEKRNKYMPINSRYGLSDLKKALQDYFFKTNRQVFIEYIMLAGINDSETDAYELAKYLKSIGKRQLLHINLIKYNQTGRGFEATSGNKVQIFKKYLENNGLSVSIRKSLGQEVFGACGQLAGK